MAHETHAVVYSVAMDIKNALPQSLHPGSLPQSGCPYHAPKNAKMTDETDKKKTGHE